MIRTHLAQSAVDRGLTMLEARNEALAIYLSWIEPSLVLKKTSRPKRMTTRETQSLISQALEGESTMMRAQRATGLAKATFFRHLKEMRAQQMELSQ